MNSGLLAFGVTTCVLVPTAIHLLDAGPKQVAKLVAPGVTSIAIGTAKIEMTTDRAFLDAGDKVHVTLTATSETHQRVTVAVLVYESIGSNGGRVDSPPARVGRDEITLDIANGTATKQLAFTLPGFRGEGMDGLAPFGHYTILVMPPADADRLETLRRRASTVNEPMNDPTGKYERFEESYRGTTVADDAKPAQIGRVDVNTRPTNAQLSIIAPEAARANDDLAIVVRVKNPSKQPVESLAIRLSARPYAINDDDYKGIDADHVAIIDDGREISLAPRETRDLVFHVTATTNGVLGLYARATCDSEQCYANATAHTLNDAVLDAVEIAPAERPVVVVQ